MSEVQKILEQLHEKVAIGWIKNDGKAHSMPTHANGDSCVDGAEQALYDLLIEKSEQRQIVVAYKKDQHHTPILQDWKAIPISTINELFGRTE